MDVEDNLCPICYDSSYQIKCTLVACGHSYCKNCFCSQIMASLERGRIPSCPMDKKIIGIVRHFNYRSSSTTEEEIHSVINEMFNNWLMLSKETILENITNILAFLGSMNRSFLDIITQMDVLKEICRSGDKEKIKKTFIDLKIRYVPILSKIFDHFTGFSIKEYPLLEDFHETISHYRYFFLDISTSKTMKQNQQVLSSLLTYSLLKDQISFYVITFNIIQDLLIGLFESLSKNIVTLEGDIDHTVKDWVNLAFEHLRQGYQIFSDNVILTKAIVIQIDDAPNTRIFDKCTTGLCCLCLKDKRKDPSTCLPYLCNDCSIRFKFVDDEFTKRGQSKDLCKAYPAAASDSFVLYVNSFLNLMITTCKRFFNIYKPILSNIATCKRHTSKGLEGLIKSISTCNALAAIEIKSASSEVSKIQFELVNLVLMNEELLDFFGDPFTHVNFNYFRSFYFYYDGVDNLKENLKSLKKLIAFGKDNIQISRELDIRLYSFVEACHEAANEIYESHWYQTGKFTSEFMDNINLLTKVAEEFYKPFLLI